MTSDRFRLQVDSRMGGEETVTARLWAVLKGVVKFERGGREEGLLILMSHGREREGERRRGRDIRRASKAIRCRYRIRLDRLGILESAARYELNLRYELKLVMS